MFDKMHLPGMLKGIADKVLPAVLSLADNIKFWENNFNETFHIHQGQNGCFSFSFWMQLFLADTKRIC